MILGINAYHLDWYDDQFLMNIITRLKWTTTTNHCY